MVVIPTSIDNVIDSYPIVNQWIKTICNSILESDVPDKIDCFYTFGFFQKKGVSVDVSNMKFDERFQYEVSKIRVNINFKISNLIFANRLPNVDNIPEEIKKQVFEIVKVKMLIESTLSDNVDVLNSIPNVEDLSELAGILKSIMSGEFEGDMAEFSLDSIQNKVINYDMDQILDKISERGMGSLTKDELDFLKKMSEKN